MITALEGIKVIDVPQVAAVPMAARLLADFGADVIHVENPTTGDSWRGFQAGVSGSGAGSGAPSPINYNWENFNRDKRSLSLDLSRPSGQEVIHRMVASSDVFLPLNHPAYGDIQVIANPVNLSETPAGKPGPAPEFGEHTEEILLEYGYDWDDIDQLRDDGIIF